jgi:hypothetical protein
VHDAEMVVCVGRGSRPAIETTERPTRMAGPERVGDTAETGTS